MKKKLLNSMRALLVAAGLTAGATSVWATGTTAGVAGNTTEWNSDFTDTYTLTGNGTYSFTFYTTNATDANYRGWTMFVSNTSDNVWNGWMYCRAGATVDHTWGTPQGTETPTVSTTYSGSNIMAAMNGAMVNMAVTRNATAITAVATVTPSNGESTFTETFTYTYGESDNKTANLYISFTVDLGYVSIVSTRQSEEGYATTNVLSENYEGYEANASLSGWTLTGKDSTNPTATCIAGDATNVSKFGKLYYAGGSSRQQYWDMGVESSLNADNWTLSFSAAMTPGNTDAQSGIAISGTKSTFSATTKGTTNPFFSLYNAEKNGTAYTATIGSTTLDGTYTLASGTWYKYTIKVTDINTTANTATIYVKVTSFDGQTTILESTQTEMSIASIGSLRGIVWGSARYYPTLLIDDVLLTKEVVANVCAEPTYTITGPSGVERKFILECETEGATIYYSATELAAGSDGWTEYTGEVTTVEGQTTIYYYAAKAGCTSSAIQSFATGRGTAITLNAPSLTKTAYADGNFTVSMASDQSGLSIVPTTHVIKYSIDGGDATSYTSAISVAEGSTVTAYVELDGYTTSEVTTLSTNARPSTFATAWTQDYTSVTSSYGTGALGVRLSASADFTVNEENFMNIIGFYYKPNGESETQEIDAELNTNVGLSTSTGFSLRCYSANSGILKNSGTGKIGIKNLNAGEYVVLTVMNVVPTASYGVTLQEGMSTTSEYYFLATGTEASINIPSGTYNYVKAITVLAPATVSVTLPSSGFGSLASAYGLDFSGVAGLTAYVATSTSASAVTLTSVTELPANSGMILNGTGGETYSIPVKADAAYAGTNLLSAAVTATAIDANAAYILQDGEFHLVTAASTVPAGKAYLLATNVPSDARALAFAFGGDEAAGVSSVSRDVKGGDFYNLQGLRVDAPTKGLYIVNGKKVIIK